MKKILSIFLIITLCLALLCACGEEHQDFGQDLPDANSEDTEGTAEAADTQILMNINGTEYTAEQASYFISYFVDYVTQQFGTEVDWNTTLDTGETLWGFTLDSAVSQLVQAEVIKNLCEKNEIDVSGVADTVAERYAADITELGNGDEAAFNETLASYGYTTEVYRMLLEMNVYSDLLYNELYGDLGANLTDKQIEDFIASEGYVRAKHILLKNVRDDEEGNEIDLTEEELAEAKATLEGLLAELDACEETELSERFDEMVKEYGEDPGMEQSPEGYLFKDGEMVQEFYDGTLALEEGQYSGIIETVYGYHIIMRLPVDYSAVPSMYQNQAAYYGADAYTLRNLTAETLFNTLVSEQMNKNDIKVEYTAAFDELKPEDFVTVEETAETETAPEG